MHAGVGFSNFNKILSCLNIPQIDFKTYKRYETEVGQQVEVIAKESCKNAAELEKKLTIQNAANIEEIL